MALLPSTRVYVTDHALSRFQERVVPATAKELAERIRKAPVAGRKLRAKVLAATRRMVGDTTVLADVDAVYLLTSVKRGAFRVVTVLNRVDAENRKVKK